MIFEHKRIGVGFMPAWTLTLVMVGLSCSQEKNGLPKSVSQVNFFILDIWKESPFWDSQATIYADLMSIQAPAFEPYEPLYYKFIGPKELDDGCSKFMYYQDSVYAGLTLNGEIFGSYTLSQFPNCSPLDIKFSVPLFTPDGLSGLMEIWVMGTGYILWLEVDSTGEWQIANSRVSGMM